MNRSTILTSLAALVAASSLSSQQAVSPKHFATVEANSWIYRPFGSNSNSGWRYQQIHDDMMGSKLTINEIAFRKDATQSPRTPAYELNVTIVMSTAAKTAATAVTTFAQNHGANRKIVTLNKLVKMPATFRDGVAAPWEYRIKLDAPYAFDGTNGGLCWEAQTSLFRGQSVTTYFDAASSSSTNPPMAFAYYGTGCYNSTQSRQATLTTSSSVNYTNKTGSIRVQGNYLTRNSLAIGTLGFSRTLFAGVLPLPLELPGSANSYSGPCTMYASLDLVFAATTSSTGYTTATVPIPVDVQYGGIKLYVQLLSTDPGSTAVIPFTTTNASEMQFVPPYKLPGCTRIYATNSLAQTGSLQRNYGLVTALF